MGMGRRWLLIRWSLLPLLLVLLGQYIEGPSYSAIVRGAPFVFSVFAVSLLAGQFLRQFPPFPKWLQPLQSLLVPMLFILTSQRFYNGGVDTSFSLMMVITGFLMALNFVVYLVSLYSIRQDETNDNVVTPRHESSYSIVLRYLSPDGRPGGIKYQEEGAETPPTAIIIDGFSSDQAIDLREYWERLANDDICYLEVPITIRETIIKFGETQQLVDNYMLRIKN
jgi:hypothetical protein